MLASTQVIMILFFSHSKEMMLASRFHYLSVVELLQNIHDYVHVIKKEPYLYCNFTLKIYLKWNIDGLFLKWPKYFPEIVYVLEKLEDNNPFFRPGCNANAKRYYNLLLHYGNK